MTPKEKAKELVEKFNLPSGLMSIERKQCALIAVENEYHSLREQIFNLRSVGVIESEKVYLFRIDALLIEEQEVKKEIEKL
jgi:hypothetical protein